MPTPPSIRFGPDVGRADDHLAEAAFGLNKPGPSLATLRAAAEATGDELVVDGVDWLEAIGFEDLIAKGLGRKGRSYREIFRFPESQFFPALDARGAANLRLDGPRAAAPEGLVLYVDIPFCDTACRYCRTVGRNTKGDRAPVLDHLRRLEAEARMFAERFGGNVPKITGLYIGGGTGSSLEPDELGQLVDILRNELGMTSEATLACEGSPNTMYKAKVEKLVELGFSGISLGIESFEEHLIRHMNRAHDAALAKKAITDAMDAGMAHTNADLILGLPGQSLLDVARTMQEVGRLKPGAVTLYSLRVLQGTAYWKADEGLFPTSVVTYFMQAIARRYLQRIGYYRSEGTRWVLDPSFEHVQHVHTRRGNSDLGLGPRAASQVGRIGFSNTRNVVEWNAVIDAGNLAVRKRQDVTDHELMLKDFLLPLKLRSGLDREAFRASWGEDPYTLFGDQIDYLDGLGFLETTEGGWAMNDAGALFETEALRGVLDVLQSRQDAASIPA